VERGENQQALAVIQRKTAVRGTMMTRVPDMRRGSLLGSLLARCWRRCWTSSPSALARLAIGKTLGEMKTQVLRFASAATD
jgi:hypothetical protein